MQISDEVWKCSRGETFDIVALNVYGDEQYAPDIMCANPTLIDSMEFGGGEILRLPVIGIAEEGTEQYTAASAPWKE